ncbi:LacI family transcriptional regulator [Raoultella sp. BIGb0138]|uniref:LacI family DNA-binding transcriptional regulator n=1 Tax=Raoultella sp. BIGb0138 TaxID=2485115 RepID=UPI001042EDEA|nr:LacI family DNA-binding transcriptional regulator [Raoultella sp. BIGb0138]TCW12807.1 LacI family transcriptional regulator [Raoultella sp. BIGb0138]
MKKNLTIKDIAELANVSIATVSRVLNKNSWVSDKTRAKVQKVIDEHQFSPNLMARSMISRKSMTLAIVVSDITNPYFATLVEQIEKSCLQAGYKIVLFDTQSANKRSGPEPIVAEDQIFSSIIDSQLDGVIILGGNIDYLTIPDGYLEGLQKLIAVLPVLVVGRKLARYHYTCLQRDQVNCVIMIARYLLEKGYRDLAFIGGSSGVYMTGQRIGAFLQTLEEAGIPAKSVPIVETNFYPQHGYQAVEQLLKSGRPLPQALLAINDRVAMGAIRALKDHKLSVPDDIAVASCEYFPGSEYFIPRITTVDHKNNELGQQVINQMMMLLQDRLPESTPITPLLLPAESA